MVFARSTCECLLLFCFRTNLASSIKLTLFPLNFKLFQGELNISLANSKHFMITTYSGISLACSAGGFWWGEWIYISIGCSDRHLDIVESWGEVKNLPSVGERKKNWEGGGGGERKIRHSVILAPILPVCSESKIAANHSIDHQNRLHCRLVFLLSFYSFISVEFEAESDENYFFTTARKRRFRQTFHVPSCTLEKQDWNIVLSLLFVDISAYIIISYFSTNE